MANPYGKFAGSPRARAAQVAQTVRQAVPSARQVRQDCEALVLGVALSDQAFDDIRSRLLKKLDWLIEERGKVRESLKKHTQEIEELRRLLGVRESEQKWSSRPMNNQMALPRILEQLLLSAGGPLPIGVLTEASRGFYARFRPGRTIKANSVVHAIRRNPVRFVRVGMGMYDLRSRFMVGKHLERSPADTQNLVDRATTALQDAERDEAKG